MLAGEMNVEHDVATSGWGELSQPDAEAATGSAFQTVRFSWLIVAFMCLFAFLTTSYLMPRIHPYLDMYLVRPVLWLLPAGAALWFLKSRLRDLWSTQGFAPTAITVALIQISIAVALATLMGFGNSPYNHTLTGLFTSLWFVGTMLIGRETARWYIAKSLARHGEFVSVGITWLLLWLTSMPFHSYSQLMSGDTAFSFAGKILLPAAAIQLLATYLALRGGPLVSIAYIGTLSAFEWFSPILPDLTWPVQALIGVMIPLLALTLLESDGELDEAEEVSIGWSWIASAFLLVAILWFNTGVFGVRPAIVQGTSMLPNMQTGDIAITRDIDPEDLQVGDVIRFKQGSRVVLHRIIEVKEDNGELVFIAQGDNNPGPDGPVPAGLVEGELVMHVPHIGKPGIYFKRTITWILG